MDQEKIGKLIASLRRNKGLTQSQLGDMVGVGFRAVSKWERGLTLPDIAIINDLSKILGISADELLKGEVKSKEKTSSPKQRNIIYFIIVFAVIILSAIIIIINNNKPYVYSLLTYDEYYIEGEAILKNNNISIKINKLGFEDKEFSKKIINNYQYEISSNNTLIFGYGYIPIHEALPSPISIESWANDFKVNYSGNFSMSKKNIIKNGLNLKITFLDKQNKKIIKNIKIELKTQK